MTSIGVEMADDVSLDSNSYAFLLKRCTADKALARGKQIHAHIIKTGLQGHASEALKHFCQMQRGGPMLNEFTFGSVLIASVGIAEAEEGKPIHAHVLKAGLEREVLAVSAPVDIYAKCQNMADAEQVFDKMRKRYEVSWGAMICGYAQNGCSEEAVRIFYDMKGVGLTVNSFALSSVLRACSECKVSLLVRTSLTKTEKIMADSKPELSSTTLHRMESFKTRGVMARRGLSAIMLNPDFAFLATTTFRESHSRQCSHQLHSCILRASYSTRLSANARDLVLSPDARDLVQWIRDEGGFVHEGLKLESEDEGLKLESEGSWRLGLMFSKAISAGTKIKSLPCHIPLALLPLNTGPNQIDAILLRLAEVVPRIATASFSVEKI